MTVIRKDRRVALSGCRSVTVLETSDDIRHDRRSRSRVGGGGWRASKHFNTDMWLPST